MKIWSHHLVEIHEDRHMLPVTSERRCSCYVRPCTRLKKLPAAEALTSSCLSGFLKDMGAGSFNPAHPCEMSDHLDSGLSAYADNGCGHVSSAFPGCAVERSPGESSLASLPSRVRSESHRVGSRSVLAYGLYSL